MEILGNLLVGIVAILHALFLVLEMLLWTKPLGRKIFHLSEQKARDTAVMAANQGLYNGFLSAGLIWGMLASHTSRDILFFFLICVIIAGVYGAITANRIIFWIQAFPALLALSVILYTS